MPQVTKHGVGIAPTGPPLHHCAGLCMFGNERIVHPASWLQVGMHRDLIASLD